MHGSGDKLLSVEQRKRIRNIRTLSIARALSSNGLNADKDMRIVCECSDYACSNLITVRLSQYYESLSSGTTYYVLKHHIVRPGSKRLKAFRHFDIILYDDQAS